MNRNFLKENFNNSPSYMRLRNSRVLGSKPNYSITTSTSSSSIKTYENGILSSSKSSQSTTTNETTFSSNMSCSISADAFNGKANFDLYFDKIQHQMIYLPN